MKQKWTPIKHFDRRGYCLNLSSEIFKSYANLLDKEAKFSHREIIEEPSEGMFINNLGRAVSYFERPNGETLEVYHNIWKRNGFLLVYDIRRRKR
jgi:hypothetical protein